MVTTDPVFPNTIYLLQAFDIYRHAEKGHTCVVYLTAPPQDSIMASRPVRARTADLHRVKVG
jgi:hypothetical protein